MAKVSNNEHLQENLMYTDNGNRYGIYQIIRGSAMDEFRFMRMDYVEASGGKVDKNCYQLVYTDRLEAGETLDSLYDKFNLNHPADYTGHSLSVSDIVVLRRDGTLTAYYVDSFGFAEVPGFMQEKDIWLEYYVAECEEFHHLKGYEVYDTLEEAALNYRILRDDMRKTYFGNALGIIYHDNKDPLYDGSEYSFIKGDVIHADGLDDVKHFAASQEVCKAVAKMQELFPDYQVIEPKNLQIAMYPENMTAEELADALMNQAEEYDFYDYQDNSEIVEEQKQRIMMDLAYGNKAVYIRNLKEMIEDDAQEAPQAKMLLNRIEGYEAEKYPEKEPMIRIRYSENHAFKAGSYYKLSEAEKKIQEISDREKEHDSNTQNHEAQKENYLLDYTLYYEKNGEKQKLDGYLGIGSGGMGIVESIQEQTEEKMSDISWLNNIRSKGEEIYQLYMTELADIQEYVLPYLQQFVTLPEQGAAVRQVQEIEKRTVVKVGSQDSGTKKKSEEKKLSIHERIERNREVIAGQRGRRPEVKEVDRV